ncbi:uncharacterized protein LOC142326055 isoform X2 [Lycorma delicatula]|uniref:uncharacterized protein LOC142326055 isoform X2 n=1 Tax=Lycorma delicatula TaxID=130591 RepID=UPI003F515BF2
MFRNVIMSVVTEIDKYKKTFRSFFRYLNDYETRWNSFILSSSKPIAVISNLTEHLQIILKAELSNEMSQLFPDVKKRLVAKLYMLLEDEISQLYKIQESMNHSNKDLRMRLTQLEQGYKQPSVNQFTEGIKIDESCKNLSIKRELDPVWPPFNELLEMANDSWLYFHDFWLNVNLSLICIDFEDEKTVNDLKSAFKEDSVKKQHINTEW